jgi:hypothetical protein
VEGKRVRAEAYAKRQVEAIRRIIFPIHRL